MPVTILADARRRPDLFFWYGGITESRFDEWTRIHGFRIPNDLRDLWILTGGGDFLESETILGPYGNVSLGDDVVGVNEYHWGNGMSRDRLIFHRGMGGLSAIEMSKGLFLQLSLDRYEEKAEFLSLDAWYLETIRAEIAWRYGL